MLEGTTTALQPVQIFLTTPAGHQWDWTALVIGAAQTAVLCYGIWVMHTTSNQYDVQLGHQSDRLRQQAIDSIRRHEQTMTALQAIIGRTNPRPPEPPIS